MNLQQMPVSCRKPKMRSERRIVNPLSPTFHVQPIRLCLFDWHWVLCFYTIVWASLSVLNVECLRCTVILSCTGGFLISYAPAHVWNSCVHKFVYRIAHTVVVFNHMLKLHDMNCSWITHLHTLISVNILCSCSADAEHCAPRNSKDWNVYGIPTWYAWTWAECVLGEWAKVVSREGGGLCKNKALSVQASVPGRGPRVVSLWCCSRVVPGFVRRQTTL